MPRLHESELSNTHKLAPGVYCFSYPPSAEDARYLIHERLPECGVNRSENALTVAIERGVLIVFVSPKSTNEFFAHTISAGDSVTIPAYADYYLIGLPDRGRGTMLRISAPQAVSN